MKINDRIEADPQKMFGKPVIKGTRITVELILQKLAGGMTYDEMLQNYPQLKLQDLHAAQQYAADVMANEEVIFA